MADPGFRSNPTAGRAPESFDRIEAGLFRDPAIDPPTFDGADRRRFGPEFGRHRPRGRVRGLPGPAYPCVPPAPPWIPA